MSRRQHKPRDADRKRVSTFTSWKLDLQKYLLSDPRLKLADKLVAVCILSHLNIDSRKAFVSAETIGDEICLGARHVKRVFGRLKQNGWLETQKTRTANVFSFSDRNMNALIDRQVVLREARQAKRRRKRHPYAMTQESQHTAHAVTQESQHAGTHRSPIHLRGTPYRLEDSQEEVCASRKSGYLVANSPPDYRPARAVRP
jgi:hypothetical protein